MDKDLSISGGDGLRNLLDRADVLHATVEQLRKDLALGETDLLSPELGDTAFEALRVQVHPVLRVLDDRGEHALKVAMYRVDIPEAHLYRTMAHGGLHALAGEVVLRALQKVLTRLRHAGRF